MSSVSGTYVHPAGQSRASLQRQFNRLLEEVAQLAESDLEADGVFQGLLQRILAGSAGVAGAIWALQPNGALQVKCQSNVEEVGLEKTDKGLQAHAELLREAMTLSRPLAIPPQCNLDGKGLNSSEFLVLLAPVVVERQTVALLEVWQDPATGREMQAAFLQFLAGMGHYASIWFRNCRVKELTKRQDLWLKLEAFSQLVHASLDLTATAFRIVNEGKTLVECDRLSVGHQGNMIAVSGVDEVDRRSSQMRLLGRLGDTVLAWGEKLVYRGVPDETLPPAVLQSLDDYLAVCGCKLLVVQPLGDMSERFVLILECYDGEAPLEQSVERLEIVGRHAAGALANAAQFERVPLHGLWTKVARLPRAKTAIRIASAIAAVVAVIAALVCVPYPLKMEAAGQLLPRERRWVYSPVEGRVVRFEQGVVPGGFVAEHQPLVLMYDMQLEIKLVQLAHEIAAAQDDIASLVVQHSTARTEAERAGFSADKKQKEFVRNRKQAELKALREQTHSDLTRPGHFWLPAPLSGSVMSWEFRERFNNRSVSPAEPLLRIGDKSRGWEVELRIPHRHAGPILEAFGANDSAEELDVDLLLTSAPTRTFRGKLARSQVAAEASPDLESDNPEPVIRAMVRISGDDIPESVRIPVDLLVSGTEVHAKVRCGPHRLGFALFHGVWEFLCEKVLFF